LIGEPDGRVQILSRLRERIVAFAASRYARDAAEDLAQEVLVVIHEKYSQVESLEELVPLSFQILRFKLMAWRRKLVRHGEHTAVSVDDHPLIGDAQDPEAEVARKEMLERLSTGLAMLGKRCQEIFRLKLQGRNFGEIRELMGAEAINTIYTWDYRCRKQLLEWMGGRWQR
jgi:RNA polymerase sigma-70 factor (ECF subfamily)